MITNRKNKDNEQDFSERAARKQRLPVLKFGLETGRKRHNMEPKLKQN